MSQRAVVGGDLRVERHLQQQVAELVADRVVVVGVDRLEQLVRLLEEVPRERAMGLLAVPRAPVRRPQPRLHLRRGRATLPALRGRDRAVGDVGEQVVRGPVTACGGRGGLAPASAVVRRRVGAGDPHDLQRARGRSDRSSGSRRPCRRRPAHAEPIAEDGRLGLPARSWARAFAYGRDLLVHHADHVPAERRSAPGSEISPGCIATTASANGFGYVRGGGRAEAAASSASPWGRSRPASRGPGSRRAVAPGASPAGRPAPPRPRSSRGCGRPARS